MLFWITVGIMVISIIALNVFDMYDGTRIAAALIAVGAGVIAFIMLICIICSNVCLDAQIAQNHERYEALVYQWENNVYENDNDVGKRELIKDIQAWNEDLAYYKNTEYDFWIGIFIPNIHDAFEFIEWEE